MDPALSMLLCLTDRLSEVIIKYYEPQHKVYADCDSEIEVKAMEHSTRVVIVYQLRSGPA